GVSHSSEHFFLIVTRDTPRSTLFPYTTLFRSHNVAEAVYLADRVIVMTSHPGMVKTELPIRLPRPRDPLSVEFLEYQKSLSGSRDRKSTRLNSSHLVISYAVFCLKKKKFCEAT